MTVKQQHLAKVPTDIEVVDDKTPEEKAKEIEAAWQHEHDRLKQEQAVIKEAIGKATAAREQQRQDSPARSKINDDIKKLEEQKAEIEKKKDEAVTALKLSKDAVAAFKPPTEKEKDNDQKALAAQIAAEAAEATAKKELEAARNRALAAKAKAEAARNAAEAAGAEEKSGRDGEDSQ